MDDLGRAGVLLVDPKHPHNVGGAVRACAVLGAEVCAWTGTRVPAGGEAGMPGGYRLPREERFKGYEHVVKLHLATEELRRGWFAEVQRWGFVPVAVEVRESAEPLDEFEHPGDAVYVFGPEDGSLGRGWLELCHRFVRIPSVLRTPLNLAAAVNIVLYDRLVKSGVRPEVFA